MMRRRSTFGDLTVTGTVALTPRAPTTQTTADPVVPVGTDIRFKTSAYVSSSDPNLQSVLHLFSCPYLFFLDETSCRGWMH